MVESKLCYNRGCGKTFDPMNNPQGSCIFHDGAPQFHDAYKSWSCCGKKTTDFSVFLATPGCQKGRHSNVKVQEPISITGNLEKPEEPEIETPAPLVPSNLPRPSFQSELKRLKPRTIAASLKGQNTLPSSSSSSSSSSNQDSHQNGDSKTPREGETCKNGGCKVVYSEDLDPKCVHHTGIPIFHEGLKFWSCCQRKTTDFQAFLDQEGCNIGSHKWFKDNEGSAEVDCRYDWHQTGNDVTIAIYAKKYDPDNSYVDVNPIRLKAHIYFPEQDGSFNLDLELKGVIDVEGSTFSMLGSKVEIKMKKAEAGSWSKLFIPKPTVSSTTEKIEKKSEEKIENQVDALDLDDLEYSAQNVTLSKEASGGRTEAEII